MSTTTTFAINLSEISRRVAQIVQSVENNVNLGGYLDLQEKSSCVDLVTDVDKKVESFLEKELAKYFPEFKYSFLRVNIFTRGGTGLLGKNLTPLLLPPPMSTRMDLMLILLGWSIPLVYILL